jgi:uncharacterized protein YgiM (DUF1202 family)
MDPVAPPEPKAAAPPPAAPPSRWIERLSGLLLLAAAAVMTYTAAPALLGMAGGPRAPAPSVQPAPLALPHLPKELLADPGRLDLDRDLEPDEPGAAPALQLRSGLARTPLSLRDKPSEAGRLVGEIPAGRLVSIWSESADWVLIASGGSVDEDMVAGWVKKSGIAVR